jgi:NAD+ synthase
MPVLNLAALITERAEAIRRYHRNVKLERAELDVSGGIDSAVMLGLLAEALGPDNITAVYSSINSSESSRERAHAVCERFGVRLIDLDLSQLFQDALTNLAAATERAGYNLNEFTGRTETDKTIEGSFRSCLRAPVGRFLNRLTGGGIRHGTGNEDEDRWLRFYQKGGDGEVDTNPIAMLSKGEVFQLAVALKVPREIIEALPTPDLWGCGDKHNDEDELRRLSGVNWTYSRIDPDSGKYTRIGTIERMNRALDSRYDFLKWQDSAPWPTVETMLFREPINYIAEEGPFKDKLIEAVRPFFLGWASDEIAKFLASARRWEECTRHKMNPNCPALGDRASLVKDGVLTDELP